MWSRALAKLGQSLAPEAADELGPLLDGCSFLVLMTMAALVGDVLEGLPVEIEEALQLGLIPNAARIRVLDEVVVALRGILALVQDPGQ